MLYLHHDLKTYFTDSKPLFDQLINLEGECYRNMNGRLTQKVSIGGNHYFIKQHFGIGWREIFKNLSQLKQPVISAKNEWQALIRLEELGIAVPKVVGYGERGIDPASKQSFVLMEALEQATSLEDIVLLWQQQKPSFYLKNKLIKEVARITRIMHEAQINHCDLYICHFLLSADTDRLYLIDLHRARSWHHLPLRWQIKDLAALYFSSLDANLTQHDLYRFMCAYQQKSLREILKRDKSFWHKVKLRGDKLYREHSSK